MDQQKLRTLVFEKTGVKIDIDDPVFALVALNEAVLEEAVSRHIALIDSTSQELVRHARAAGGLAPQTPAARHQSALLDATNEALEHEAARNDGAPASTPGTVPSGTLLGSAAPAATDAAAAPRLLALAGATAVLSALLVLTGQALFFKPVAAPAPIVQQAKQLTAAQILALDRADKLDKAILKLDPKTRAQLQAELVR